MNAMLQQFFMTPAFRLGVLSIDAQASLAQIKLEQAERERVDALVKQLQEQGQVCVGTIVLEHCVHTLTFVFLYPLTVWRRRKIA